MRRLPLLIAALLLCSAVAPAAAVALDAGIATSASRTDAETRAKWAQLKPAYSGSTFTVTPSTNAPYAPGVVSAAFLDDGLRTINFARYLAGLPHDVVLDSSLTNKAQYGAVLLAAGTFSHNPPKPGDMTQSFYDLGLSATSSSNIGLGYSTAYHFEMSCLQDSDSGNINRLGHRRWLLNPRMQKTGIGYAQYRAVTWAFDSSRSTPAYSAIAYPSAGPFPVGDGFLSSQTPWSVTLNPARYDWDASGHKVTLKRVSDGMTWTFTAADTNTSGEYFNFERSGYGVANAFIFRPNPSSITYRAGDEFVVTLSGGIYLEGTRTPTTVSYRTRLISLADATTSPADPGDATALTIAGPKTPPAYGGSATLTAVLKEADGSSLSGKTVAFERWNGTSWVSIGSATTDTAGKASKSVTGLKTKQSYRTRFGGLSPYAATSSASVSVVPKARLTRVTSWTTLGVNKTYYATGYIEPKHATTDANKVRIMAYKKGSDGVYRYVKSFSASYIYYSSSKTKYRAAVKLTSRGAWKLVALHSTDSRNARTYGSADYVSVR